MSKFLKKTKLAIRLREVAEALEEDRTLSGKIFLEDLAALDTSDPDLRQLVDQVRSRLTVNPKDSRDRERKWKEIINILLKDSSIQSDECKAFVSEFGDLLE